MASSHFFPAPGSAETLSVGKDPRLRRRNLVVPLAMVAAIAGAAGVWLFLLQDDGGFPGGEVVQGVVSFGDLSGEAVSGGWSDCRGTGRFAGLESGATVAFEDGNGSDLGGGEVSSMDRDGLNKVLRSPFGDGQSDADVDAAIAFLDSEAGASCQLFFTARIGEADSYFIRVGDEPQITYSRADIVDTEHWLFLNFE